MRKKSVKECRPGFEHSLCREKEKNHSLLLTLQPRNDYNFYDDLEDEFEIEKQTLKSFFNKCDVPLW